MLLPENMSLVVVFALISIQNLTLKVKCTMESVGLYNLQEKAYPTLKKIIRAGRGKQILMPYISVELFA